MEAIADFRRFMQAVGLGEPNSVQVDGELHRFKGEGDKRRNAWYYLHANGRPAGACGSWRTGQWEKWQADVPPPDPAEQRRFARMAERQRKQRAAERDAAQERTAEGARAWWAASPAAVAPYPYLSAKQVQPHGLRQSRGLLLVALRDLYGTIWNIQTIARDGRKRFLRGGRVTGLAAIVGNIKAPVRLLICEGWATAATLHAESGAPVLAAMNCGNLYPVAKNARERWPDADIIICGDDDRTTGNPGRTAASKAANAIHARLTFPTFTEDEAGSDFNDLANLRWAVTT